MSSSGFPQNPECRAVYRTRSLLMPGVSQSSLHPQCVKQSDCQIRPDEEIGIGIGQRAADVGVEMFQCAWLTFLQAVRLELLPSPADHVLDLAGLLLDVGF